MAAVQRPISVNCIQRKVPTPAWKTKPSWFLLAEEDRMILPDRQRFMAERMGAKIRSHKVDHTPMHTAPELVVDIILEAAQSTPTKETAGPRMSFEPDEGHSRTIPFGQSRMTS